MSKKKRKQPTTPRPQSDSMDTLDEPGAPAAASADDPETWDASDSGQTFLPDSELPAHIIRTMNAAWVGAIEPNTPSGMTVKGNVVVLSARSESQETWAEPGTEDLAGPQLQTIQDSLAAEKAAASPPGAAKPAAPKPASPAPARPAPAESGDTDDSVDRTFISDEFVPVAGADAGGATVPDAEARQRETDDERTMLLKPDGEDSIEKTFISDEFAPLSPDAKDRDESQRTEAGSVDVGMKDAAVDSGDSFEATLISDSHSGPEHVETMESGTRGVPARKTSPGDDDASAIIADETDLVIKVRAFRQQDGTGPNDAEYQIKRVLGEGGMGIVFDAVQTSVNRAVAVKMMKKPKAGKKADQYVLSRQKFLAEAVVTGDLDHPNIVPIYDVGRDDKNALFYSMKNVVGTPWLDVIRSRSVHENLEILMRVADAVAFAHARGVVHRDLKPENVMLGEFGEILVMDWGLAFPTPKFRKVESVRRTTSMGGTPAYMAPEMATGPIDKIGTWSDIYLLGAMLYEIVTGKPPHRGKNAMKCLMAAAKNQIEATDKKGELLDVALKAMASEPKDRYKTVQDFQSAIREYLSHTESITLSTRADDVLLRARQSGDYEEFQEAVYGFKEAYELWKGNKRAISGLAGARLAYAECALRKEDFDLGISQLDVSDPQHAGLHRKLVAAKAERDARVQRIKTMKRVGLAAGLLFLVTAGSLTVWAMSERTRALGAEAEALTNYREAERQRESAEERRKEAEEAQKQAVAAQKLEAEAREKAEESQRQAVAAQKLEAEQREKAEEAQRQAVAAQKLEAEQREKAELAQREAEYRAYVARIGLSAAQVDENAFETARANLEQIPLAQRNWEWGRLMHLCSQHDRTYETGSRVEAVALSPDGARFVAGGWDGTASVFDQASGELLATLRHSAAGNVRAVAFSNDGALIATGGDDRVVRLWKLDPDAGEQQALREFRGHTGAITSVDLSQDGRLLLTGSEDESARIWNVATGQLVRQPLRGHYDPVWAVAFSPDGKRAVTASQDKTVKVWESRSGHWQDDTPGRKWWEQDVMVVNKAPAQKFEEIPGAAPAPFRGHRGPVFAAAFSNDGKLVATAGFDRQILVWDPEAVETDQFANVSIKDNAETVGAPPEDAVRMRLEGHLRSVRSLRFSPDGRYLVSGGDDNAVKVWEIDSGIAVQTFRGHDQPVRSCVFDPLGAWVLSGSYDERVKKWSMTDYEELRQIGGLGDLPGRSFDGHGRVAVLGATFSPDGQFIVTASQDRTAKKWDFRQASEPLETFQEGHEYLTSSAAVASKGGKLKLVTSAVDNTTRIWDVLTGTEEQELKGTGLSAALAVSPDGNWILTGSNQKTAQLWRWRVDATTLKSAVDATPLQLEGRGHEITAVAFSADGDWLFLGDNAGHAVLWKSNGTSFQEAGNLVVKNHDKAQAHTSRISDAVFVGISGRTRLLTASADGTVAVWDVASGNEIATLRHGELERRAEPVVALAVTSDGRTVITSCEDRSVRVWKLQDARDGRLTASEVGRLDSQGGAATLAANVKRYLGRRGEVSDRAERCNLPAREIDQFLRDASLGTTRYKAEELQRFTTELSAATGIAPEELMRPRINSLSLSADGGRLLAANSEDAIVQVWDLATLSSLSEQTLPVTVWSARFVPGAGYESDVLVVGGNGARLWNLDRRSERISFTPNNEVASAAFSPDGQRIVTASWDNSVRIWDATTGRSLARLVGHQGEVRSAVFSDDGRHVLTASKDGTVKLWAVDADGLAAAVDANDEQVLRHVVWSYAPQGTTGEAWQASFSPDGDHVIAAFGDGVARILSVETGAVEADLKSHAGAVLCATFSPDGKRAITGSDDLSALLWDLSDLAQPRATKRLRGHTSAVTAVAFSPNNERALTGSRDTTVKLWDVSLPQEAADDPAAEQPAEGEVAQAADQDAEAAIEDASELLTLSRHKGEVTSVQFSPETGQFVLSGSKDGTAIVWLAWDWTKELPQEERVAGAWRARPATAESVAGQE
ncbi:MAG TPA: protein kinase [Planctomycetaceae bacterium]|nr:protein kinase [Planctomycetaceae bacterium]